MPTDTPSKNTDIELWREDLHDPLDPDNVYAPNVFVTERGAIGMSAGGHMMVYSILEWMRVMDYFNRQFNSVDPGEK